MTDRAQPEPGFGGGEHGQRVTAQHYFTADPDGQTQPRQVRFTAAGRDYELAASGGVFSSSRLDPGTAVLLRKAPLPGPRGGTYLDLGCGYGPIAAVLADTSEAATVYAVDVNRRALELVRGNASRLDLAGRLIPGTPDEVPDAVSFDEIWSNPPVRVGKAELHSMLARWLPRVVPGGSAWLVVGKNLGGDSLQAWLTGQGWPAQRYASQKGYRVIRVTPAG